MNATPIFELPERDPEIDCMCDACLEAEARTLCLEFARVYSTPSVRAGVDMGERGDAPWGKIAAVFARAYGEARNTIG